MQHRGQIVEKAISDSGITKGHIAKELLIDVKTLYNWLSDPKLKFDNIFKIYDILKKPCATDFEELRAFRKYKKMNNTEQQPVPTPTVHQGLLARLRIEESHIPREFIASRLGKTWEELEKILQQEKLKYSLLIDLYKALKVDVRRDFPEIDNFAPAEDQPIKEPVAAPIKIIIEIEITIHASGQIEVKANGGTRAISKHQEPEPEPKKIPLDTRVNDLDMDVRTYNIINQAFDKPRFDITLADIIDKGKSGFEGLRGCGNRTLLAIDQLVREAGYSWNDKPVHQ